MPRIVLNGPWQLRPVERFAQGHYPDDDGWLEQSLPAHWQQHPQLAAYAGRVVYRRRFVWPGADDPSERAWLRAPGIFYWSAIYLNGQHLGSHEGYFTPQEYEVTESLRPGENELVIEVECRDESRKHNKRMITGVFSHWNVGDKLANPGGIWLPVEVYTAGPVQIGQVQLRTVRIVRENPAAGTRRPADVAEPREAVLDGQVVLNSAAAGPASLVLRFAPENFAGPETVLEQAIELSGGTQEWSGQLLLPSPRLWWTWDLGAPALYRVTVQCRQGETLLGETALLFGVRQFELRDWIPYLNGLRFFVRGANYPPGDMRIATMTAERYAQDIALARGAAMNLLRLHAHVQHPAFYEAADRHGILVWQDFPLQWAYAEEALPAAEAQVVEMVRLLYNHPSVVIWCMHNEPIWQEDHGYKNTYFVWRIRWASLVYIWNRFIRSWDREVLDTRLQRVVRRLDPSRPAVRASGEIALPFIRQGTDTHFYFGWYAAYGPKRAFEWVRRFFRRNLRFVTEFGAQSFPNEESVRLFLPADIAQVDWEEVSRRYAFQPDVMALWLDWRKCRTWAELIALSQGYQAELNRYYIDRLRYHKYRPTGGIVMFNLVDPCVSVQWSVVDYWRRPKGSYAALCRAFAPQYIFTLLRRDLYRVGQTVELPIYLVNDAHREYSPARATAEVVDAAGASCLRGEWTVSLPADSPALCAGRLVFRPTRAGLYRAVLSLDWGEGTLENEYEIAVK